MKKDIIRNALSAHGWIGLLISVPLFIVFWAGAITLFYPEVSRWAVLPHHPVTTSSAFPSLNNIVEKTIEDFDLPEGERISLRFPGERSEHIGLFFSLPAKDNNEKEFKRFLVDPITGERIGEDNAFKLADFFYQLHYDLKLPQGAYIVGIITLFFMMLVITGLLVQLKNLVAFFFAYRHEGTLRNKMKDLHNVVGVISLPYGFMYALTGLMFNLGILFQIPSAFLLFDGDTQAMTKAAGFGSYTEEYSGETHEMPDLNALVTKTENQFDAELTGLNVLNYGDKAAAVRLFGSKNGSFAERVDKHFVVADSSFSEEFNPPAGNVFADGIGILFSMHFANFAGIDVRVLFFIVALGVCGMIVAGNVLWFVKNAKKPSHPKTMNVMKALTLGGCVGVVPATAFCFLLERVLPEGITERAHIVEIAFAVVLLGWAISGFVLSYSQRYVGIALGISAGMLLLTVISDWVMFTPTLVSLFTSGMTEPVYVSAGLFITAALLALLAKVLVKPSKYLHNSVHADDTLAAENPAS